MHDEAIYWVLLTERHPLIGAVSSPETGDNALAALLDAWLSRGNRSLYDLFALHPEPLAASLGMSLAGMDPLLALRARLPRMDRPLALLRKAGVDILPLWDRRCPRALRAALDGQPPVLWFAGNLALLDGKPVALAGARESGPHAVAFARELAVALAAEGRVLLTGLTRAVERSALEGSLGTTGGTAIAVLGQGIARSLPELQRLQDPLREGRLLVLSPLHPDAFWQPRLELLRSSCLSALAERVVIADPGEDDGIRQLARLALDRARPVLQYVQAGTDAPETQLDAVLPLTWPSADGRSLAQVALNTPRAGSRELREHQEREHKQRAVSQNPRSSPMRPTAPATARKAATGTIVREAGPSDQTVAAAAPAQATHTAGGDPAAEPAAPAQAMQTAVADQAAQAAAVDRAAQITTGFPAAEVVDAAGPAPPVLAPNQKAVLDALRRKRGAIGKGMLLQLVGVAEPDLDSALVALIASGLVAQRPGRSGAGYAAVRQADGAVDRGFQLSLFGQQLD